MKRLGIAMALWSLLTGTCLAAPDENGGEKALDNRIAIFATSEGTFEVELFEDKAPRTTENFIELAEKGFYAIFGKVVRGMDVVKKIGKADCDRNDRPRVDVVIKKITLIDRLVEPEAEP